MRISYVELYNEKLRDLLYDLDEFEEGLSVKERVEYLKRQDRGSSHSTAFDMTKQNMGQYKRQGGGQNLKIVEDPAKGVIV